MNDPIDKLAVEVAEDHKAKKRRGKGAADVADTVAAGAIEGAGAALDAGGDARDVAAATVGGAIATAELVGDGTGEALPPVEDGVDEMREAIADLGDAVERAEDDDRPSIIAERIEEIAASAQLDTATLVGDLTAAMLDLFKTRPKPWSAMLEADQRQVAVALKHAAQDLVTNACALIVGHGDGTFYAKVEGYANKGAFKIALTAEATRETSDALFDCEGQMVLVRRYDPKPFGGTRREPQFDADQPGLGFEADAQAETSANIEPEGDDERPSTDDDLADGKGLFADDTDRDPFEDAPIDEDRTHDSTSAVND